jgi:hypothetical protein
MKKHVSIFWKPPINSNHQSTANQHSQYLWYTRDRQLSCICDVLHGLKLFPIEIANEVTDNRMLVPGTIHKCTKSPLNSNGLKNKN